jgi:hypothetical protein
VSATPILDLEQDPPLTAGAPRIWLGRSRFGISWLGSINICVETQSLLVNVALWLPLLYGVLIVHELEAGIRQGVARSPVSTQEIQVRPCH